MTINSRKIAKRSQWPAAALTTLCATAGATLCASCAHEPQVTEPIANVRLAEVETSGAATSFDFPGRVEAAQEVNMSFMVSGTLSMAAEDGTRLAKGQVVAAIDPRDYQVQMDATQAEYEQVKAEAERVMALYADSVCTADDYDKARYGLQQITAKRDNARNQLADTKIYAPFDCTVQRRLIDPPTVVGAGMPVVSIVSDGRQEVVISIPSSAYMNRHSIKRFTTTFDYAPGREVELRLISMSPKANANQLHTVRLAVPAELNPQPSAGMNAMVRMTIGAMGNDTETEVPSAAIFVRQGKSYAWVYDAQAQCVRQREVEVLRLTASGRAVVKSGLMSGEKVVSMGVHKLIEGQRVKPMAPTSDTNVGGLL